MKIDRVTLTGANDKTNIQDLIALSKDYPFAEWGILLSKSSEGSPRFPSLKWMEQLNNHDNELNLSGHLCGRWVRDIVRLGQLSFVQERHMIWSAFKRIQINFHGEQLTVSDKFYDLLGYLKNFDKQFIFQMDIENDELFYDALKAGVNAVPLFDTSHGAGISPDSWPAVIENVYCGYAGGLSPENLKSELDKIANVVGDKTIWIDAETKVRSDNDLTFDLAKVEAFLKIAEPYTK